MANVRPLVRRDVVACVVSDGAGVCLVRRSPQVSHDRGRWHCVTGYLERRTPGEAVLTELSEELGLMPARIDTLRAGQVLHYVDDGVLWVVHTFAARTRQRSFRLNWENDAYAWVRNSSAPQPQVWWLTDVYRSLGIDESAPKTERRACA